MHKQVARAGCATKKNQFLRLEMKRKNKKKGNKEKQHINGEVEDEISAPAVHWPAISGEKRPEEKKKEKKSQPAGAFCPLLEPGLFWCPACRREGRKSTNARYCCLPLAKGGAAKTLGRKNTSKRKKEKKGNEKKNRNEKTTSKTSPAQWRGSEKEALSAGG